MFPHNDNTMLVAGVGWTNYKILHHFKDSEKQKICDDTRLVYRRASTYCALRKQRARKCKLGT
jgi:hypothetical protein